MRPHALHPGAIQGKEGIKFCHLATLLSIKGVDFIEASSRASGGARRLTSGTGTVELAVAKLLDEATGEVRVVPVHLRGVADKKIKAAAFEK